MTTIQGAIKKIAGAQKQGAWAKVCTVKNVGDYTCDVEPVDGTAPVLGVKFKPVQLEDGLTIKPANGSTVLVVFTDIHNAQVVNVDKADLYRLLVGDASLVIEDGSIEAKVSSSVIEVGQDGIKLERMGINLKDALVDLCNALIALTVTCAPQGLPSSPPVNFAAFNAVITKLNQVLK